MFYHQFHITLIPPPSFFYLSLSLSLLGGREDFKMFLFIYLFL